MPIPIPCPGCNKRLRVPDAVIGKKIKCPACTVAFVATGPTAGVQQEPNPFEIPDESSPSQANGDDRFGALATEGRKGLSPEELVAWKRTRVGVDLILGKVFLNVLALAIIIGGSAWTSSNSPPSGGVATPSGRQAELGAPRQEWGVRGIALGVALLGFLGHLTSSTGLGFCVNAPVTEAKVMAILALVLAVPNLVSYGGTLFLSILLTFDVQGMVGGTNVIVTIINIIGAFLWFFELLFILLLIRGCASSLNDRGLARSVVYQLVLGALIPVITCGMVIGLAIVAKGLSLDMSKEELRELPVRFGMGALVVAGLAGGLVLLWSMWYVASLFGLRGLISRRLVRRMA